MGLMHGLAGPWLCLVVVAAWTTLAGEAATLRNEDGTLNITEQLRLERLNAEELWHSGQGVLWFQHYRRAGGTSLCHLLRSAVPLARFLLARGQACQPEDWNLRDAVSVCEHNLTLVRLDLQMQGGNAFAQEYGPMPGADLIGHRVRRHRLRNWVFVASIRDPWSRFWSQLKYELATCLSHPNALARCVGGNFEELGHWWSPTAHRDSVLGVPPARISDTPALYVDNYYTRILLNRTDIGEPLTVQDLYLALEILEHRVSAVIIVEDFATSALQLACSLGLDVDQAYPLLRKKVRPYESHEALMQVPQEESALGKKNVEILRSRFVRRNWADYSLYSHARVLSRKRLAACGKRRPEIENLRLHPPPVLEVPKPASAPKEGDPLQPEISVDDLFGCTGGSVELGESGQYILKCPRSASQHADSWWATQTTDDAPVRKRGQAAVGAECWKMGFSWSSCCSSRFGARGNRDCWDKSFTFERCCVEKKV